MKAFIMNLFVLVVIFTSSNALAEWTIAGTNCAPMRSENEMRYNNHAIENMRILGDIRPNDFTYGMWIMCSSPVHHGYGSVLDLEFFIHNTSEDPQNQELYCQGYSYDKLGNVVQSTERVSQRGATKDATKLVARQREKLSDGTPVTIGAFCYLPDRSRERSKIQTPSKLFSVRVY